MKRVFLALAIAIGFVVIGCPDPNLETSDPDPNTEIPDVEAVFTGLSANGSTTATTTALTLTFDKDIEGLAAADITLNGGSTGAVKGALQKIGTGIYTLNVTGITAGGTVTASAVKTGYSITGGPKTVQVYYHTQVTEIPDIKVVFTGLTANGSYTAQTDKLTMIFDKDIAGLNAADITLNAGTTSAVKGVLTRTATGTYELAVSGITHAGRIDVSVEKTGYEIANKTWVIDVWPMMTIAFYGIYADGWTNSSTTELNLSFSNDIPGLTMTDIIFDAGSTGSVLGTLTRNYTGSYNLGLTGITGTGTVSLKVAKEGYIIAPDTIDVTVYLGVTNNQFSLNVTGITDITITITLPHYNLAYIPFSKSNDDSTTMSITENYDRYEWYIGDTHAASGDTVTFYADNPAFITGKNRITIMVYTGSGADATVWSGNMEIWVTD